MKIVVDPSFCQLTDYISRIPTMFQRGEGELVYDKRNSVARFNHAGLTLIVKRFKRVNFIQQIVYSFFRQSKAERAFQFAEIFRERGIDTPQRVAYMEQRRGGLFSVGYFVSLESVGTETHLLLREVQNFSPELADAVANQVVLNFLCQETGGGYHFTMIDINRSHFTDGWPTEKQCMENLVRLTHRRDLYDYLVRSYARQRDWDEDATARWALKLLERFENRRIRL